MPTLNVAGHRLHYVETGGGDRSLVLVHGAGGSVDTWVRQLEGLADVARVIALDLPGHGASDGDGCASVAHCAAVVGAFLTELGNRPVVLGGHSMGGAIVQAMALGNPAQLSGLILAGTGARLRVLPSLLDLLRESHARGVDTVHAQAWSPTAAQALVDGARRTMLATRPDVVLGDYTACNQFDVMARVGDIRLPTLVIVGEDDRLTPPKYAEHLAHRIPGARLVRIPHAGHYAPLEQPDDVNRAIREFLRSLP